MRRLAPIVLAACGASPAPAPVDNTTSSADPRACAPLAPPDGEPVEPGLECARGDAEPLLAAGAAPPSCHAFARSPVDPRHAFERVVLDGIGEVTLEHGGCAHWWVEIRGPAARATTRLELLREAAALIRARPADLLDGTAEKLDAAAQRGETSDPVEITEGYEHAYVSAESGRLVIRVDIAL